MELLSVIRRWRLRQLANRKRGIVCGHHLRQFSKAIERPENDRRHGEKRCGELENSRDRHCQQSSLDPGSAYLKRAALFAAILYLNVIRHDFIVVIYDFEIPSGSFGDGGKCRDQRFWFR
jgi:hypothetical protein